MCHVIIFYHNFFEMKLLLVFHETLCYLIDSLKLHVLHAGHLIFFFLCQAYNRSLMTDLSGWTTFILCVTSIMCQCRGEMHVAVQPHQVSHNCAEVSNFVCGKIIGTYHTQ